MTSPVVRARGQYETEGSVSYFSGISANTVGAKSLCMTHYVVAPTGIVNAHVHEHHEAAMFVISGSIKAFWGEDLQNSAVLSAGDFMHIPVSVPHRLVNEDSVESADTIVVRSDPFEPERTTELPELELRIRAEEDVRCSPRPSYG
jgi:uncharacterized RmlC-like cupin family protein